MRQIEKRFTSVRRQFSFTKEKHRELLKRFARMAVHDLFAIYRKEPHTINRVCAAVTLVAKANARQRMELAKMLLEERAATRFADAIEGISRNNKEISRFVDNLHLEAVRKETMAEDELVDMAGYLEAQHSADGTLHSENAFVRGMDRAINDRLGLMQKREEPALVD